jgi:hypothetical protein
MIILGIFAVVNIIGGIAWVLSIRKAVLWFVRNLRSEARVIGYLESTPSKLVLWLVRMYRFFHIGIGIVFGLLLIPGASGRVPAWVTATLIALPVLVGITLLQLAIWLSRRGRSSDKTAVGGGLSAPPQH